MPLSVNNNNNTRTLTTHLPKRAVPKCSIILPNGPSIFCRGFLMYITTGTRLTLPTELWQALLLYRYRVFVEKLGWHLDCAVGEELDQFDRDDTVYVIARQGPHIVGVARLLPTHTNPICSRKCSPRCWVAGHFLILRTSGKSPGLPPSTCNNRPSRATPCHRPTPWRCCMRCSRSPLATRFAN